MPEKWIGPAEYKDMLQNPAYQEMRKAREAEHAKMVEARAQELQPLLEDLKAAGVVVDRLSRLLEMPAPDAHVYRVLLDHLTRPYSPWLLEWIGRAFGHKSARAIAWDNLVNLIKSQSLEMAAVEGVLVAISEMARPSDLTTLLDLVSDRSIGKGRVFLVKNLIRSKKPEALAALLRLQDDPDLATEIMAHFDRKRDFRRNQCQKRNNK